MASFFAVIVFCLFNLSSARDTLLPGEFLYPNQSLMSLNGMFKFGFIESGVGNYTVGIWLTIKETENSELPLVQNQMDGVVWTANTENSLTKLQLSKVSVSQYGTLILTQSHSHIWSSGKLQKKSNCTKLVLLHTGNLVLQDQKNKTEVIWQSFYHPTDTWLPGAWLGYGTINREKIGSLFLTSSEHSPWVYSFNIYNSTGTSGFVITEIQNNVQYFGTFPKWISLKQHDNMVAFNDTNGELTYIRLDGELGDVYIFRSKGSEYYSLTNNSYKIRMRCYCGPFGMCLRQGLSYSCKCPYGFHPASPKETYNHNFSSGCERNVSLSCNGISVGSSDTFIVVNNVLMQGGISSYLMVPSVEECESACRSNCSCTAYAYLFGCNLWYEDLIYTIIDDDHGLIEQLYIRIAGSSGVVDAKRNYIKYVVFIGGCVMVILFVCLILLWHFRTKPAANAEDSEPMNGDNHMLKAYSYKQLKRATKLSEK